MQEHEKAFIALVVMGRLIALGKMLNSDESHRVCSLGA
jgi:hypothetical protein